MQYKGMQCNVAYLTLFVLFGDMTRGFTLKDGMSSKESGPPVSTLKLIDSRSEVLLPMACITTAPDLELDQGYRPASQPLDQRLRQAPAPPSKHRCPPAATAFAQLAAPTQHHPASRGTTPPFPLPLRGLPRTPAPTSTGGSYPASTASAAAVLAGDLHQQFPPHRPATTSTSPAGGPPTSPPPAIPCGAD